MTHFKGRRGVEERAEKEGGGKKKKSLRGKGNASVHKLDSQKNKEEEIVQS